MARMTKRARSVFPACAGMNRRPTMRTGGPSGVPHMRGDEPAQDKLVALRGEEPLVRILLRKNCLVHDSVNLLPTAPT